jgi:hypothetical protein
MVSSLSTTSQMLIPSPAYATGWERSIVTVEITSAVFSSAIRMTWSNSVPSSMKKPKSKGRARETLTSHKHRAHLSKRPFTSARQTSENVLRSLASQASRKQESDACAQSASPTSVRAQDESLSRLGEGTTQSYADCLYALFFTVPGWQTSLALPFSKHRPRIAPMSKRPFSQWPARSRHR